VAAFFKEKGLLQTEHALLDDNGDGAGSRELDEDATDGSRARALTLRIETEL
jgi:hypothetical protein